MAWNLTDVLTDISHLKVVLNIYQKTFGESSEGLLENAQREVYEFLLMSDINIDHIDDEDIPEQFHHYEYPLYRWLADDYHRLLTQLDMVYHHDDFNFFHFFGLREHSQQYVDGLISLEQLMKQSLRHWRNDNDILPYLKFIKATYRLIENYRSHEKLMPGMILLEVMLSLIEFNQSHQDPLDRILSYRNEYVTDFGGTTDRAIIEYSDFLWDKLYLKHSFFDANYRARSTLHIMMYAQELQFGELPEDIYGLMQYITMFSKSSN